MPLSALALVITAAALHAGWNLLVKGAVRKQVFTGWAVAVGGLVCLPLLALGAPVPASVWPYAVASGAVEAAYIVLLVRAYERGDFSLVYPVARGAAPALLVLWGVTLLGERPRPAGIIGLALLLLGLLVVGAGRLWKRGAAAGVGGGGVAAALGVALCISVYSAIDGAAVRLAPTPSYLALIMVLMAAFATPVIFARCGLREAFVCWREQSARIILVGVLSPVAYLLVLRAYAISGVSYAGALREVSVVLAALAGWRLLKEPFGAVRVVGSCLIFAGIVVIAVAG
jgi:drug/metabolite transporter (DMT)-like permease